MKLCLNNKESVTVVQNHFRGELTKQHAFTITNHGSLRCREFGCPAEQEESPGTDAQQLKTEIAALAEQIIYDIEHKCYIAAITHAEEVRQLSVV